MQNHSYIQVPVKAVFAAGAVVGGFILFAAFYPKPATAQPPKIEPVVHAAYIPESVDGNIAFHQARVKKDPGGAIGWGMLADAWLVRSRESDSDAAAWEAEAAARKSLSIRAATNSRALGALVSSTLEQHRFQDALRILQENKVRTRLTADVLTELGRYDEAKAILSAQPANEDPSVYAGQAKLASLRGDHGMARMLLERSREALVNNPGVPATSLAWFNVKLGDEVRACGDEKRAEQLYRDALALHARNYKATLALSRLMAARKNWAESIRFANQTLTIADSLDAKALLGDAYKAQGDEAMAKEWYDKCLSSFKAEVAHFDALGKGGPYHVRPIDRQFATFSAEHKMFVDEAIVAAKRDLANRPDPHAHQTLTSLLNIQKEQKS